VVLQQEIGGDADATDSLVTHVYYAKDDILVSNKVVRVGDRAFNPNLIASVSVNSIVNPQKSVLFAEWMVCIIVSAGCIITVLVMCTLAVYYANSKSRNARDLVGYYLLLVGVFGFMAIVFIRRSVEASRRSALLDPWASVDFDTSSGREKNIITTDLITAKKIEEAIVKMIVGNTK
jgi:hypothetical protein